jgi:hypothetical protein
MTTDELLVQLRGSRTDLGRFVEVMLRDNYASSSCPPTPCARGRNASPYLPTHDDFIASRGGNPLVVGGKIIGAIGVSAGTGSQDDVISLVGVAGLK